MAGSLSFDVLVIGSGASGLAAGLSAERAGAHVAVATKGSLQSCNSAKAQGGIQAAFGEDDSPELHAADVWTSSRPWWRRYHKGRSASCTNASICSIARRKHCRGSST